LDGVNKETLKTGSEVFQEIRTSKAWVSFQKTVSSHNKLNDHNRRECNSDGQCLYDYESAK